MIRKVRVDRTTYSWVDSVAVEQQMEAPSKMIAINFVLSFIAHCVFVVCLCYIALTDVQVDKSFLVQSGLQQFMPTFNAVSKREELMDFLINAVPQLVSWDDKISQQPRGFPTVLGANALIGAVRIVQNRVPNSTCQDSAYPAPLPCVFDYLDAQREAEVTNKPPFVGQVTGAYFPYIVESFPCPSQMTCGSDAASRIRPTDISYPYSGYTIQYYKNQLLVNGTNRSSQAAAIFNDFVDSATRHIRVSAVLYNPQINLFIEMILHFELPITGGIFPFSIFHYLPLVNRTEQPMYTAAEVLVWLFIAWSTIYNVYFIATGFRARASCLRCESTGMPNLVTRCTSCSKPLATRMELREECAWCGFVLDAVPHCCWKRRVYDPWVLSTFACNLLFTVARIITTVCRNLAQDEVQKASIASLSAVSIDDSTVLFSPIVSIAAVSNDFLAVTILLGALRTYRFTGRFAWSAVFLKTFSRGVVLLSSFFLSFAVVFIGFAIAFHLLQCDWVDVFSTLPLSLRGTFLAVIMVVDWGTLTAGRVPGWVFMVVYVSYIFTCALVMLNVLVSVITYEYKSAKMQISPDVEFRSLELIAAPLTKLFGGLRTDSSKLSRANDAGSDEKANSPSQASSEAIQQAGVGKSVADVEDDVAGQLAEVLERESMMTSMITDTWRNMRGMAAVIDATNPLTIKEQIDELRLQLQNAQSFVERYGPENRKQRARSLSALGYDEDMPLYHL